VYRRVLVPLDGSAIAEGALSFIRQVAGPLDLDVTLLCVVVPSPPGVVEGGPVIVDDAAQLQAKAEAYLAPLAAELRAGGVRVATEVRRGDPVIEILAGAREMRADLIAMTTHGRTGFGRLLLGSVAEAVLRQSGVPVILMRQTGSPARRA
jgi:nucleotide-binding universal stress UspA family protein